MGHTDIIGFEGPRSTTILMAECSSGKTEESATRTVQVLKGGILMAGDFNIEMSNKKDNRQFRRTWHLV